MAGVVDIFMIYQFLKRLVTPFNKMKAYELGIIDENGNVLKKRRELTTTEERKAFGYFDILVINLKKLLATIPGGRTRIATYAAALMLIREGKELDKELSLTETEQKLNEYMTLVEEAPTVSAGSGQIAGIGVGPDGEPGFTPKQMKKYKKKNRKVYEEEEEVVSPCVGTHNYLKSEPYKGVCRTCGLYQYERDMWDKYTVDQQKELIDKTEKRLELIKRDVGSSIEGSDKKKMPKNLGIEMVNEHTEINELFNRPAGFKIEKDSDTEFLVSAKVDDDAIGFVALKNMGPGGKSYWDINFYVNGVMDITGSGNEIKVFSTVLAIIKDLIESKDPTRIEFSADKSEGKSRSSLYKRLVDRFAKQYGYKTKTQELPNATIFILEKS